jgi:hypothetical protein
MKNDIIIFSRNSEKTDYTKLSDEEWQNLEVIDVVTKLVVKKMVIINIMKLKKKIFLSFVSLYLKVI